eukprot:6117811-Pyramimonas_sp.AAC.1
MLQLLLSGLPGAIDAVAPDALDRQSPRNLQPFRRAVHGQESPAIAIALALASAADGRLAARDRLDGLLVLGRQRALRHKLGPR